MTNNFYLGQRVVCINADFIPYQNATLDGLTVNQIYTVAEIYIHKYYNKCCIRLEEIQRNPQTPNARGYLSTRFRPLKINSLDLFHNMCKNDPATNKLELMRKELQDA